MKNREKLLFFSFLLQLILVGAYFLGKFIPIRTNLFLGRRADEWISVPLIWSRANFDGVRYLKIAQRGYGAFQQAFFPLYPLAMRFFSSFLGNCILGGVAISFLSFLGALFFLQAILKEAKIPKKTIDLAVLSIIFFPTSFYFFCVYTESLFLFEIFLSFYLAQKKRWFWAGLAGALASGTRVVGIFLLPALLWEYYQQNKNCFKKLNINHLKDIILISFSSLGLITYMAYLKKTVGDWFYFATVQSRFGMQRTTEKLIILPQVFWRYLKMVFTVNPHQWLYFNVWLELITALLFLFLLSWGWYKRREYKIRISWLIFASLAYILPTLTGTFSSMPRYVLVCFPAFIVLGNLIEDLSRRFPWLKWAYFIFSPMLLVFLAAFFFRGYWVA